MTPVLPGRARDAHGNGSGEAGFTLAMFLIVIAVMSIMMGAAVQAVSFQMQREKEAGLIFRGEQYVEAIRLYKQKYGRHPMRLKEIWEADPKVIRKQWQDPITDSLDWGVVFVGQGGRQLAGGGGPVPTGTPRFGGGTQNPNQPRQGSDPTGAVRGPDGEMIGPISGVYSRSCDESIKVYKGRTAYCDWKFVLEEQQGGAGAGGQPVPSPPTGPGGWHPGDPIPTPPPTGTPGGGGGERPPSYGTTPTPGR